MLLSPAGICRLAPFLVYAKVSQASVSAFPLFKRGTQKRHSEKNATNFSTLPLHAADQAQPEKRDNLATNNIPYCSLSLDIIGFYLPLVKVKDGLWMGDAKIVLSDKKNV
jgi:hypothetical protein